jgi:hypothetical protein
MNKKQQTPQIANTKTTVKPGTFKIQESKPTSWLVFCIFSCIYVIFFTANFFKSKGSILTILPGLYLAFYSYRKYISLRK